MCLRHISSLRPVRALVFVSLAWIYTTSAVLAADRERLLAFLDVTGFGVALDSIALSASDAPTMLGLSANDFGYDWTRVSTEVFDTEIMRQMALEILSETLDDDLLAHAADFYATPLGQRLVALENASHMMEDDAIKQTEGQALVSEGVESGSDRLIYLRQMNDAVDVADVAVLAVQEIQVRFLMAASYAGVLSEELDEAVLREVMRASESELRIEIKKSSLASAAYTYRDLDDNDLRSYVEALQHPDMQKVYGLMNAVQYEIMANRFEVLAGRMAELYPGQEL